VGNVIKTPVRIVVGLLAAGLGALAIGVAGGGAAVNGCTGQTYEQPFLPWLDPMSYVLVAGGTFEGSLPGWTLSGGAKIAAGNEPFYVHAKGESHSLSLPAGSSVTTASICVTLAHPDLRFFARNTGSVLSTLAVSVVFPVLGGGKATLPIGTVVAGSSWQPTLPVPIVLNALALLAPNGTIPVSFVFKPLLFGGGWQVDDVYVDPYKGH
jgi:hypothetical protein